MSISVDQINRWGKAPSESEEEKCRYSVQRVTRALQHYYGSEIDIYLQGSYRNRTNIKKDSDVDIVIQNTGYYFPDTYRLSPEDKAKFEASFVPSPLTFKDFKNKVMELLISEFGQGSIERKNKCIRVIGDQYRINADVVPCFTLKRYARFNVVEVEGIALLDDYEIRVESFPKQHYENGANKNLITEGAYKSAVRVLKNVRNVLIDNNHLAAESMPSFLLECLVWNVPNSLFSSYSLYETTKQVISRIYHDMLDSTKSSNYAEVSDLRWLLRSTNASQDIEKAKQFTHKAWNFIGYK